MKTNIGIADQDLVEVATLLNILLSDEYALFTKSRNAHWNITGPNFYELHKLFQMQYETIDLIIDDTAERVRSLGHYALGSMKDFMNVTHLSEAKYDFSNATEIIQTLAADHETIIRSIRKDIAVITERHKDLGTGDFITGLMEKHENMVWMLRASLP